MMKHSGGKSPLTDGKGIDYREVRRKMEYSHELRARYLWRVIRRLVQRAGAVQVGALALIRRTAAKKTHAKPPLGLRGDTTAPVDRSIRSDIGPVAVPGLFEVSPTRTTSEHLNYSDQLRKSSLHP